MLKQELVSSKTEVNSEQAWALIDLASGIVGGANPIPLMFTSVMMAYFFMFKNKYNVEEVPQEQRIQIIVDLVEKLSKLTVTEMTEHLQLYKKDEKVVEV
jgi:hypothetical protein